MILKYIRNRKYDLVGCIVAIDRDKIGWSLCNLNAGDVFNKSLGVKIAQSRALIDCPERRANIPHTVAREFAYMKARSEKYFKK